MVSPQTQHRIKSSKSPVLSANITIKSSLMQYERDWVLSACQEHLQKEKKRNKHELEFTFDGTP